MRFLVLGLVLLALSAALLTFGAELFAEHAGAAGRRVGVTALAVGLLVAGAEPEEMITAAIASARHHPGIALGDALGANVTMLTLVLGSIAVSVGLPLSCARPRLCRWGEPGRCSVRHLRFDGRDRARRGRPPDPGVRVPRGSHLESRA
jgi:sodium/calcium exchanger protein